MRKLRDKEPEVTTQNLLKPLFKRFIREVLAAMIDEHLKGGAQEQTNRSNGKSTKTIKSTNDAF